MANVPNRKRVYGDRVQFKMAVPVNTPAAGDVVKFFDPADGLPYWRDELGVDHPYIGGSVDTLEDYDVTDDFTTRLLSATSGPHGVFGWFSSSTAPTFTHEANHPGIIKLPTNQGVVPINSLIANAASTGVFLPAEMFTLTFLFRTTEVLTKYTARIGLNVNAGADDPPANGIYIEELLTDTNYFLVTRSGAAQTRVDTGVARSIATWHKAVLRRISASVIGLSIDGSTEVTSSTNIPTGFVNLWIQHKSATTGVGIHYVDTDYVRLEMPNLTR